MVLAYKDGRLDIGNAGGARPSAMTAAMVVFTEILGRMVAAVTTEDSYSALLVRESVQQALVNSAKGLNLMQLNELRGWFKHMDMALKHEYSAEQMAYVLHLLYVGACEYFGPGKTDGLLAQIISEVKKLPEARVFSPQAIL